MAAKSATAANTMEEPLLIGRPSDTELSDQLLSTSWTPLGKGYQTLLMVTGLGSLMLFGLVGLVFVKGIGLWGNNQPVGWAFDIINFVWWVGIGHAGTFISAILLLLEQKWRTSINRFAEGMTIFAVIQAGLFPVIHTGRPWFAYWLFPYPSTMEVWPNMRSALPWDAAAISTYITTSILFWYLGLVPDLASARDRAPSKRARMIYGIFALGWRGSARHWQHYRIAYSLLGGLAAPLVVSVHSVVSMDFASGIIPGWHATIFPPFFVAGAIFSGFAMVLSLVIPCRKIFRLENVITMRHIEAMCKVIIATGWIVTYAYGLEFFIAWYSGEPYEFYAYLVARPTGPSSMIFWVMMFCNVVVPQVFWTKWGRTNLVWVFIASLLINVGMWAERFVIIVMSTQQDFLPSAWHTYVPTIVDFGIFVGTVSFFLFLFLLFIRWVPFVPLFEVKEFKAELEHEEHAAAHGTPHQHPPETGAPVDPKPEAT